MRRILGGLVLGGLILGGLALAVDYQVNGEGGPPNLAEAVAAAFLVWQGVEGADVEATITEGASNLIRYGGGDDFGPETFSLTLQRTTDDTRRVEVLLNPTLEPQSRRRALLHETGVLAGLNAFSSDEDEGVMNPTFPAGAATALSEADREAIRNLETFSSEDVNRDGVVDFYDLSELAAFFGQSGVSLPGDINDDGVVDDADLALLREAYVFGAPSETDPTSGGAETGGVTGGADFDEDEFGDEFDNEEFDDGGFDETTGGADIDGLTSTDEEDEDNDLGTEFGDEGFSGGAQTGGS